MAGCPNAAARSARLSMLHAPSRSEYSEWTCRWTAPGVDIGPTSIGAGADGIGAGRRSLRGFREPRSGIPSGMVKQGPIPAFVHSLIEYLAGMALIAAPLLLDYSSGAAKAVSIVLGVLVVFLVATTTSTMSLINQVPLSMHIVFDYVIAAVLIASPFLFSFSDESTPTAVFLAAGVLWLLMSIGTRYKEEEHPPRGTPKREKRGPRAAARPRPAADASIPEFEPPPPPPPSSRA